jgi:low affinity Fe/Cu permease
MLCLIICVTAVGAFVTKDELFIAGTNLTISLVTLLILPILQATQNRDGAALQAKIDELIKATADARDDLIGLEKRDEREIEKVRLTEGVQTDTRRSSRRLQKVG